MIRAIAIDDDPAVLAMIEAASSQCCDVRLVGTAMSVAEGTALIAAGGFDVLLCDLGLPDGNGLTLITEAAAQCPESDVIVLTVFAEQARVLESIAAGANGYLLKDERLEDCIAAIRQIRAGGSPISPVIARQLLQRLKPAREAEDPARLSLRESEVLNLLARGFSYAEIAELLSVSAATVPTYIKRIYRKLEVNSRAEAVFEATSRGILNVR